MPPGTARYWSWLFAAAESRAPLLGIYALGAEWQALMDPATESSVAHLKLAWWQEEMQRLAAGSPVHPISHLSRRPAARGRGRFRAAARPRSPPPPRRSAARLWSAAPISSRNAGRCGAAPWRWRRGSPATCRDEPGCATAPAPSRPPSYLSKSIRDYRREARVGRVPFAVDELLAAGIDNADLAADPPPPHLRSYLERLARAGRAILRYRRAGAAARAARPGIGTCWCWRRSGAAHLNSRAPAPERRRLKDMLLAWTTARRAHR